MRREFGEGVSGIVLAGGQSRRLGRDKAVEVLGGQPMIRRVLERVAGLTAESIVVVADRARGDSLPLLEDTRVVPDVYPGAGSLGGIFSGLAAVGNEWAMVAGGGCCGTGGGREAGADPRSLFQGVPALH